MNYTWMMSAITIWSMWLAGDKKKLAWILGLINQVLWLLFIYQTKSWGLLPMNIVLWFTYARNLYQWKGSDGNCLFNDHIIGKKEYVGDKHWKVSCKNCDADLEYFSPGARLISRELKFGFRES